MGLLQKLRDVFVPAPAPARPPNPDDDYVDEAFGRIWRDPGQDWEGEIPFTHEPTGATCMHLCIVSEGRPTDAQRELFREIMARYESLWPEIAASLAKKMRISMVAVNRYGNYPFLNLGPVESGKAKKWSLQYQGEGDMGYFVEFVDWNLTLVFGVD